MMKKRRVISGWGDTATDSPTELVELAHPMAWPFILLGGYLALKLFLSPDRPRKGK